MLVHYECVQLYPLEWAVASYWEFTITASNNIRNPSLCIEVFFLKTAVQVGRPFFEIGNRSVEKYLNTFHENRISKKVFLSPYTPNSSFANYRPISLEYRRLESDFLLHFKIIDDCTDSAFDSAFSYF